MELGVSAIDPWPAQMILWSTYLLTGREETGEGGGGQSVVKVFKVFSQDRVAFCGADHRGRGGERAFRADALDVTPCPRDHSTVNEGLLDEFPTVFFVKVYSDPEVDSLFTLKIWTSFQRAPLYLAIIASVSLRLL